MSKQELISLVILLALAMTVKLRSKTRGAKLTRFYYKTVRGEYIKNYVMVRRYKRGNYE